MQNFMLRPMRDAKPAATRGDSSAIVQNREGFPMIGRYLTLLSAGPIFFSLAFAFHPAVIKAQTAIEPPQCRRFEDNTWRACYKEIRIINNTESPLYAVIQGSIQLQPALNNCNQGDVWLQRALNDTTRCFPVKNDYYIYVNPLSGLPPGMMVQIFLPWYSGVVVATPGPNADSVVDWWRAGRLYIFDDITAFNESYLTNRNNSDVAKVQIVGLPLFCQSTCTDPLEIFRVKPGVDKSAIKDQAPYQLNEWTFADVGPLPKGILTSLNMNYNVSNVDQLYLPIAIEPLSQSDVSVGYVGTVMSVSDFRTRLTKFTGAVDPKQAPPYWPIYNNPEVGGKKKYPNAGIRLPSPLTLFNFYMNPTFIYGCHTKPLILPFVSQPIKNGAGLPQHVVDMVQQFNNCTKSPPVNCTISDLYGPIKKAFDMSYQEYSANCKPLLSFLAPPISDEAYLRFVHGWVPFRVDPP